MTYISNRRGLTWMSLTREQHDRTCGYWYTVQSHGTALTAFRTRAAFLQWLANRELAVEADIPEHGEFAHGCIGGEYREAMHLSYEEFYAVNGYRGRELSNSQYTLAIYAHDDDGLVTVHTLNPNCADRPIFDHLGTQALIDVGTEPGEFPG